MMTSPCRCGCGKLPKLVTKGDPSRGYREGERRAYASHECYLKHRAANKQIECSRGHGPLAIKVSNGKERTTCRVCNTIRHRARTMGVDPEQLFSHWPPPKSCELCLIQPATHLDHNHATNLFRGWLCNNCNSGLGMFKDSSVLLNLAIEYLGRE